MVRLVFRPYTQVRRSICTSESLRTSTRVSSGFVLLRHSSPSFGSQRVCSCSASSGVEIETGRWCARCRDPTWADRSQPSLSLRPWVCHPVTRTHVRLLGPCFKTGRMGCRRKRPETLGFGEWTPAQRAWRSPCTVNSPRQSDQTRDEGVPQAAVRSSVQGRCPPADPKHCPKAAT